MNTLSHITSAVVLSLIAVSGVRADGLYVSTKSLTVQFADLDLNKPEGAATLFGRIRNAARSVCISLNGTSIREKQEHAACVEFALANAVARVDQPILTEYITTRTSRQSPLPIKVASGR
ncbi:UrcA family protein [Povalibacter sp.]|uniref:UrcA family protein n=1 Tax=Povalibacter sp. TaxID=1962978 RepID=UPI002F422A89